MDRGTVCGIAFVAAVVALLMLLLLTLRDRRKMQKESVFMKVSMTAAFIIAMITLGALIGVWIFFWIS